MSVASSTWGLSQRFRVKPASSAKVEKVKGVLFYYLLALILVVFLCSLFYIWSRIQIVNLGYSINREITLKEQLQDENKRLSLEVASLKSPIRLENLAKNDLKMDLPQKSQILSVQSNSKEMVQTEVVAAKKEKVKIETNQKVTAKTEKKVALSQLKTGAKKTLTSTQAKEVKKVTAKASKEVALKKEVKPLKLAKAKSVQKVSKPIEKATATHNSVKSSSAAKKTAVILDKKTQKIASIAGLSPHR